MGQTMEKSASAAKAGRRDLRFSSVEDILADAEACAAAGGESSGNWTAAQNIDHVRRVMTFAREGGSFKVPLPFRVLGRLMKKSVTTKQMKSGFKIPSGAAAFFEPSSEITLEEAMSKLRSEVAQVSVPGTMTHASPMFGPMSHEDWVNLNCRHAEMHFSFLRVD